MLEIEKDDYEELLYWLSSALWSENIRDVKSHLSFAIRYLKSLKVK